jgi:hypothetical protein
MARYYGRERIIPANINKSIAAKKQEAISGAPIRASPLTWNDAGYRVTRPSVQARTKGPRRSVCSAANPS